jgi:hypothetical protein
VLKLENSDTMRGELMLAWYQGNRTAFARMIAFAPVSMPPRHAMNNVKALD